MEKQKATKRALLTSLLSLVLCCVMLIGTTYAWFTDSVTSANNKIVAGDLKIDLELLDKETNTWNSIKKSKTSLFNYDKWEPGYTSMKVLKVENEGSLALKWTATFSSNSQLGILADVIDVYVKQGVTTYPSDRADLVGWKNAGTLREFVTNIKTTTHGELLKGESATLGIALKMRETAGNEYKNQALGFFDITIYATQLDSESDSFGPDYDKGLDPTVLHVDFLPDAAVEDLAMSGDVSDRTIDFDLGPASTTTVLPVALKFSAPQENMTDKVYKDWNADFVVKFSKDVKANQVVFLGYHQGHGMWVPLPLTRDVKAGEEVRVMTELFAPALGALGFTLDIPANAGLGYEEIANYFSPFTCGVIATTDFIEQNASETLTKAVVENAMTEGFTDMGFHVDYTDVQDLPANTQVTLELRMYETIAGQNWDFGGIENGTSYVLDSFTYVIGK